MTNGTPTREAVAAEVRGSMAKRSVTQQQLADQIGMSRVSLSVRLRCHRAFDTDDLAAISGVLGIDFLAFFPTNDKAGAA